MPLTIRTTAIALFLTALLLIGGCSREAPLVQERMAVFGTWVDITIASDDQELARRGITELSGYFQQMHRKWHAWDPGDLTRLNQAIAQGESLRMDDNMITLLKLGQRLEAASGGLFNPAIGKLIEQWGFHTSEMPSRKPPSKATLAQLVAAKPSMADLRFDDLMVGSDNPAVQMDFGGFAKGYAVDWSIERLQQLGINNAIINAGGDLRAIGTKRGTPWRIGVQHPQGDGILATIEVQGDEAIFTSGNYVRYNEQEGIRYPHIIDPRTGMPVQGVTSVTVIHTNGAEADAAATALVVAGPDEWHATAKAMGIRYVLLADENGVVHINPAMRARVTFDGPEPKLAVSAPL